jgi:hypothetical protein
VGIFRRVQHFRVVVEAIAFDERDQRAIHVNPNAPGKYPHGSLSLMAGEHIGRAGLASLQPSDEQDHAPMEDDVPQ